MPGCVIHQTPCVEQELATNKEIGEFRLLTYNVGFPMVEKTSVTGAAADPLYKQLNEATGQPPKWNFHKYLITPGARQVYSFNTRVEPDASEIMGKLTPLLKQARRRELEPAIWAGQPS